MESLSDNKKRVRSDSDESSESKTIREDQKRVRSDSDESELNSSESEKIREDLFQDSDELTSSQELDSFIKIFEEEISTPANRTSESGPDLEFLLEASDDELGLPPTESDRAPVSNELGELSEFGTWLDDQIPIYNSFEYGFDYIENEANANVNVNDGEYVALDGLFDHTDVGFGPSDLPRRTESLPA